MEQTATLPAGRPTAPTFEMLLQEQASTQELISQLYEKLQPVLIRSEEPNNAKVQEIAISGMAERLVTQQSINGRLASLMRSIDL